MRKSTKSLSRDSRCPGRDSNSAPPEYKSRPTRSVLNPYGVCASYHCMLTTRSFKIYINVKLLYGSQRYTCSERERSRDSSASVVIWLQAWRQEQEQRDFPFFTVSRPAVGPTQPNQWVPGALSPPRVKRWVREGDCSLHLMSRLRLRGDVPPLSIRLYGVVLNPLKANSSVCTTCF
jgi:hypothetical protein